MLVTVEEVGDRRQLRRFVDLPVHLHRGRPGWTPPVLSVERARLDVALNPYFEEGDAAYLLARRAGRPAGRLTAHVERPGGPGRFGFFESVDDLAVARALLDAAAAWLAERSDGRAMVGPLSFTEADGAGIRVAGHDRPAATAVPWHPPSYAGLLEGAGCQPVEDTPWWWVDVGEVSSAGVGSGLGPSEVDVPAGLEPYRDDRLVLAGDAGTVVAVPDLAVGLRGLGLRSAWGLARRARDRRWEGCVVVRVDGDPAELVPAVAAAAAAAGYRRILTPWVPAPADPPTIVQRLYRRPLA